VSPNDNFFRASQIGVNGSNIAYAYDADGLLTGAGNMTLTRDPCNGLVTGTALGQIATTQSYDSFGRVSGFTAKQGATVLFDEQYQRDNAGNLTRKTVTLDGQTSVYDYAYDPAGRLTDVTKDGIATGHFEYDANGNRILAYGTIASYDDQDRLTGFGNAQYAYTANGELQKITGATTASYEYDVSGNLKHVDLPNGSTLDYLADGRNRRVGKKVNGTLVQGFLYQDQLKPAAELNGQGNVVSRFVYAGKANVPDYMVKGGVTYRIIGDQLGSVRLVINSATGQIAQRIDYDEWGNVLSDSNPGFQPFGFAGGLYDRDTGLVRFGARDYDSYTGRWTVKDPIGFGGGDSSLYNYVGGDPLSFIDPLGLFYFGKRPLANGNAPWIHVGSSNPLDDYFNTELSHEHGFFEDSKGGNIGFGPDGRFTEDPVGKGYRYDIKHYDDDLMREALKHIEDGKYSNLPWKKNNCQDWAERLRKEYERLQGTRAKNKVKCKCK